MGRRKIYIPITRSGSSILASVVTQLLRQPPEPPTHKATWADALAVLVVGAGSMVLLVGAVWLIGKYF